MVSDERSEDWTEEPRDTRAAAAALVAARERRERIVELIRNGRRRDGITRLADVAIAVRVGCRPSEVVAVRNELLAAGESVEPPAFKGESL